ncbi:MAG: tail fiber domain-containing protein, partial [Planctomycetota bacterium]
GIQFHTGAVNGYTNAVERMRITPTGDVGIGTNNPTQKLDVNGTSIFRGNIDMGTNDITNATNITATNLTGTLQTASQPNITSIGTLASLTTSGAIDMTTGQQLNLSTDNQEYIVSDGVNIQFYVANGLGMTLQGSGKNLNVEGDMRADRYQNSAGNQTWLSGTTLGSNIVNSSLTSLGTLTSLNITGDLTVDTNTLYVDSVNNNVGIGTDNPLDTLDLDNGALRLAKTASDNNYIRIYGSSDDGKISHYDNGIESAQIKFNGWTGQAQAQMEFYTKTNVGSLTLGLFQSSDANVGIGTNNPTQKLQVQGDALIQGGDLYLVDTNEKIASNGTDMTFHVGGSEVVRFKAGGNVGIGTNNPAYNLDVPSSTDNETIARLGQLKIRNKSSGDAGIMNDAFDVDQAGFWQNSGGLTGIGAPNNDVRFYNGTDALTETMRINTSGNVGIGTNNPSDLLHINGTGNETCLLDITTGWGRYKIDGNNGIAEFGVASAGAFFTDALAGDMIIKSTADKLLLGSGSGTSSMTINTNGRIGIGDNTPTRQLDVISSSSVVTAKFYRQTTNAGVNVFVIASDVTSTEKTHFIVDGDGDVTNTNGSYGTISDRKFKKDIIDANSQWEDIKNIRFRKYKLIDEDKEMLGVVAQELELVSPHLVSQRTRQKYIRTDEDEEGKKTKIYEDEEYKCIKQSVMYMKGMVALQEALLRIETLEREIDILKRRP